MWKNWAFWIVLVCIFERAEAQNSFSGIVVDSLNKPIAFANIFIKKKQGDVICFFTTKTDGKFQLTLSGDFYADTLVMQAIAVGFYSYDIVLQQVQPFSKIIMYSKNELPAVVVKSTMPIVYKNDTITYDVKSFSNLGDKVIGDVIRKLPGVEVSSNGTITYKGKSITHFYIEGDDLLGGKYNIATNNISSDAVEKIQVLENHQNIRALQNKIQSEEPAINIVLNAKSKIKFLHTLNIGVGVPTLYDLSYANMLFRKKLKLLNLVKMNNVGIDISNELAPQTSQRIDFKESLVTENPILSVSGGIHPPIDKQRYNFNKSKIASTNLLLPINAGLKLKINASYLNDELERLSSFSTRYYLPSDTISFAEQTQWKSNPRFVNMEVSINANNPKYYLDNSISFDRRIINQQSYTNTNIAQALYQLGTSIYSNFSNRFKLVKAIKTNAVIEWSSYISNYKTPQSLAVFPGLYSIQLNQSIAYSQLRQNVETPSFYTINSVKLSRFRNKGEVYIKIGVGYLNQKLRSYIELFQDSNQVKMLNDTFRNKMNWSENFLYADFGSNFKLKYFKINVSFPVKLQFIKYGEQYNVNSKNINRYLNLTPQFGISYITKREREFNLSIRYSDQPGTILDVYNGKILTSYRSMTSSEAPLLRNKSYGGVFRYTYSKSSKFFSSNLIASYSKSHFRYLAENILTDSLQFLNKIVSPVNIFENYSFNARINKYYFPARTNISVSGGYSRGIFNQMQNGLLVRFLTNTFSANGNVRTKLSSFANGEYEILATWQRNSQNTSTNFEFTTPTVRQILQKLNFSTVLSDAVVMRMVGEAYHFRSGSEKPNNSNFLDLLLLIRSIKLRTDFEFVIKNVLNNKEFVSVSQQANTLSQQSVMIRERMFILKASFRF